MDCYILAHANRYILSFLPLLILLFALGFITIINCTIIDFKIRAALRNREIQGFQSALIYMVFGGIIGLLMMLNSILQSGQWHNFKLSSLGTGISLIFIYLLYFQKRNFLQTHGKNAQ